MPDDPGETGVLVTVTDGDGAAVNGVLGVGLPLPYGGAPSYGPVAELGRRLWWRPTAPLPPGSYQLTLVATALPSSPDNQYCGFHDFERTLALTVPNEPAAAPTLVTRAELRWAFEEPLTVDYGTICDERSPFLTRCANAPGVCCWFDPSPLLELETSVSANGLDAATSDQYVLFIEHDPLRSASSHDAERIYPVADGVPVARTSRYRPAPREMPFPQGSFCVLARLYRLTSGEVVATGQSCVAADTVADAALGPESCDAVECATTTPWTPPDPNADDVANVADEPAISDAIGADAAVDTTSVDPVPAGARAQGCGAGGPAGGGALAWLVLLACAAAMLRRTKHP